MADNDFVYLCPKANGNWCYLPDQPLAPASLRSRLIKKIVNMRNQDIDAAREEFKFYNDLMPWLELGKGVKQAMGEK